MAPKLESPRGPRDEPDRLLAGLWQEAPFARLPPDAPEELSDYVEDVEDPRRVYIIHQALRRHGFQHLVNRYIIQLRQGCGVSNCPISSCFTCRKRLAGKTPIRRYNPTSARTLAVYLAGRENPEQGLCSNLRPNLGVPAAAKSLGYSLEPRPTSQASSKSTRAGRRLPTKASAPSPDTSHLSPSILYHRKGSSIENESLSAEHHSYPYPPPASLESEPEPELETRVKIHEKPESKDHRSFAAATFSTAAFKMLEWLTYQGVGEILGRINDLGTSDSATGNKPSEAQDTEKPKADSSSKSSATQSCRVGPVNIDEDQNSTDSPEPTAGGQQATPNSQDSDKHHKGGAKTTVRAAPATKPSRRTSLETPATVSSAMEARPSRRSHRPGSFHYDKLRPPKAGGALISRGLPEIPSRPTLFENVPILPVSATRKCELSPRGPDEEDEEDAAPAKELDQERCESVTKITNESTVMPTDDSHEQLEDYPLPQTLSRLTIEIVEFISHVFEADKSSEDTLLGLAEAHLSPPEPKGSVRKLARKRQPTLQPGSSKQWKAFNEQVIFSVLSDPRLLLASFTRESKLYDSQSLWYCMICLVRVAPTLVLHSLWLAAESLFVPPSQMQKGRPSEGAPHRNRLPLSDSEAGHLLSICLHGLMAAASLATDSRTMYEMSRIRSNGLALAESGAPARQPPSVCLEYDDVFSNEVALKLARRLFRAITARRCFAEMTNLRTKPSDTTNESDVLRPLLSQLDLLSPDSIRILEFSSEQRLLHETRAPTLLLDWARAVLLADWDGQPEYSTDGPFSGALSFIAVLYQERNMLLLGDTQFRIDYFAERLDSVDMPVTWLNFVKTRQRGHILDHPWLFNPETLVTLFRSINFSQMSRKFEESSSLKNRMDAIVKAGSLITNPHHKAVLRDMFKIASSKYLILGVSRENVLQDAFDQLWRREHRELLRPFKVHLGEDFGEAGFDSGGVQQEFFRMAIAECLDPRYGAFTVDDRTRMAWFVPGSIVETWKLELIGLLVSLAVYNGLTLPITFPRALYRKLLGYPVSELHHIADGWPDLASGLTTLVEWDERDGLVEDIFARTYEFSVSAFGKNISSQMDKNETQWPQGLASKHDGPAADMDEAPLVTSENRDEYVSDYIRYLTDVSVRPQFEAFEKGFRACLEPRSLSLLSPSVLQSLVEGVQEIDIAELRRYARYVGWDSSHHAVRDFWSVVKRYDEGMKRKLLEFVTASDRVPVGGMRNLQFVIQKNGEPKGKVGQLPTAYTCFGTLLLPEYESKDILRERLGMALENSQGFGFA